MPCACVYVHACVSVYNVFVRMSPCHCVFVCVCQPVSSMRVCVGLWLCVCACVCVCVRVCVCVFVVESAGYLRSQGARMC